MKCPPNKSSLGFVDEIQTDFRSTTRNVEATSFPGGMQSESAWSETGQPDESLALPMSFKSRSCKRHCWPWQQFRKTLCCTLDVAAVTSKRRAPHAVTILSLAALPPAGFSQEKLWSLLGLPRADHVDKFSLLPVQKLC